MPQATIHVVPRPYQAWIENGLLNRAGSILSDLLPKASRVFLVTVAPVRKRWGTKFLRSLKASGFDPQVIMPFDKEHPFKNLGIRTVSFNGQTPPSSTPVSVEDIELTSREFREINGAQQLLRNFEL